jgi:hypothetical protein
LGLDIIGFLSVWQALPHTAGRLAASGVQTFVTNPTPIFTLCFAFCQAGFRHPALRKRESRRQGRQGKKICSSI